MIENFENMKNIAVNAMKDGMEKATAGLTEVTTLNQANIDAVVQSSQLLGKGLGEVAAIAAGNTKAALERGIEAAKSFGEVKSFQDVIELQSNLAKTNVANFIEDFNKISEIMTSTSKEAVKPVSDRASELFSKIKVAAQ